MLYAMLFIVVLSFALTTALPTRSSSTPITLSVHCEEKGKFYADQEKVPNTNPCLRCICYADREGARVGCLLVGYPIVMCYNPVDMGPNVCYRYHCPEQNCITPSGHVLTDFETHYFKDDGFCVCPDFNFTATQWKREHGVATCTRLPLFVHGWTEAKWELMHRLSTQDVET